MVACACLCLWHLYIFTYCLEFDYNIRTWSTHQCHCIAFGRFLILRRYAYLMTHRINKRTQTRTHTHTHTRLFHPLDSKYVTQLHVCACAEYHVRFEMMDADVCDDLTSKAFTLFHLFFVWSFDIHRHFGARSVRLPLENIRYQQRERQKIAQHKLRLLKVIILVVQTHNFVWCVYFRVHAHRVHPFLIYAKQFSLASRSEKLIICSLLKLEWYRGERAKGASKAFSQLKNDDWQMQVKLNYFIHSEIDAEFYARHHNLISF